MNTKLLPNKFLRILETVPGITDMDKVKNLLSLWGGIHEQRKTNKKLQADNIQFQTEFNGKAPEVPQAPTLYPENTPLDAI